jgi:hypothetical protein
MQTKKNSLRQLDDGRTQRCDGANWINTNTGGVPKNTVAFFMQKTCPTGWYEPTAWRGYFLRAWNPSGSGPDAGRGFKTRQNFSTEQLYAALNLMGIDDFQFWTWSTPSWKGNIGISGDHGSGSHSTTARGVRVKPRNNGETRPVNVSLLVCIKQ